MPRCLHCNESFTAHRSDTLFCSVKCRVAYHRASHTNIEYHPDSKTILSLCDFTGNWSRPYEEAGYNVIRIDLKHGQDVRFLKFSQQPVYGILAAPPCTVFANSGRLWKRTETEMLEGLSIVDACLRSVVITNPRFWVLENPVGSLNQYLGKPAFYFNPCDYGGYPQGEDDRYTKRTCLWGKFNRPKPLPVEPVEGSRMNLKYGGKSERTKTARSTTPLGFAYAFFHHNQ